MSSAHTICITSDNRAFEPQCVSPHDDTIGAPDTGKTSPENQAQADALAQRVAILTKKGGGKRAAKPAHAATYDQWNARPMMRASR